MVRSKKIQSEPVDIDGHRFTVNGRLWEIDWPNGRGIWLRPTAVQHQYAETTQTYLIRDTTRLMQISLIFVGILIGILWSGWQKRRTI